MDKLISSLANTSLGLNPKKLSEGDHKVYISEVSSPTRLWLQVLGTDCSELDELSVEMKKFYDSQNGAYSLSPNQVVIGMKVAANPINQWDRAEVISSVNKLGKVRLFFIDYGTCGWLDLKSCRLLLEQFNLVSRKAIRGSLSGIKPKDNARLWDLKVTEGFIKSIQDKIHLIKIVKHHEHEDFYELILYNESAMNDQCATINEKLVISGEAELVASKDDIPSCLSYPSFNMLEKQIIYPSFEERWCMQKRGIDFNKFEESHIQAVTNTFAFEKELMQALIDPRFAKIREVFVKLMQV